MDEGWFAPFCPPKCPEKKRQERSADAGQDSGEHEQTSPGNASSTDYGQSWRDASRSQVVELRGEAQIVKIQGHGRRAEAHAIEAKIARHCGGGDGLLRRIGCAGRRIDPQIDLVVTC